MQDSGTVLLEFGNVGFSAERKTVTIMYYNIVVLPRLAKARVVS